MSDGARQELLVHGTCVAYGARAALLRGPAGSGKSDLALRFLFACAGDAVLIADDRVCLIAAGNRLVARPPETIVGLIEVRGIGIVEVPHRDRAELELIVDLAPPDEIERLPPDPLPATEILGISVAVTKLAAFEASSAIKLKLLLAGTL